MQDVHLQDTGSDPRPRIKPRPTKSLLGEHFYLPSDDGTDENLLVMLHGLGDTHIPFSKLGQTLKLPQTAVLALRAPDKIPYLYEEAYQWYDSFDELGELLVRPDPSSVLDRLLTILNHLHDDCVWPFQRIHLFGFAQGGSVAAELALKLWRSKSQTLQDSLGSVVTVSGPLLSYPTLSNPCPTPILFMYRSPPTSTTPLKAVSELRKGFTNVTDHRLPPSPNEMPASKAEWHPIMQFWSNHLGRRQVEGVYEVMSGITNA